MVLLSGGTPRRWLVADCPDLLQLKFSLHTPRGETSKTGGRYQQYQMHIYYDSIDISTPLALAIMALLGYVFGTVRRRRRNGNSEVVRRLQKDLSRAKTAVSELEKVLCAIQEGTAKHYARLQEFRKRIKRMEDQHADIDWDDVCREVESILDPTLEFIGDISNARDRIHYQSSHLLTFSDLRTDHLTQLGNRRALEHVLTTQFGLLERYGTVFSLAIVDIDRFKDLNDQNGHQFGDQVLRDLSDLLLNTTRTVDVLARYGGDELVIVMPQTDSAGTRILCERLRGEIEKRLPLTASIGAATAGAADTPESLFARADAALYAAKKGGRNCVRCDCGAMRAAAAQEAAVHCSQQLTP
jgi:diguanylate cyclase (GGDEF)-like protein